MLNIIIFNKNKKNVSKTRFGGEMFLVRPATTWVWVLGACLFCLKGLICTSTSDGKPETRGLGREYDRLGRFIVEHLVSSTSVAFLR